MSSPQSTRCLVENLSCATDNVFAVAADFTAGVKKLRLRPRLLGSFKGKREKYSYTTTTMVDQGPPVDAQCPTWASSLGYMGVAAAVCLSNWGSAVSGSWMMGSGFGR